MYLSISSTKRDIATNNFTQHSVTNGRKIPSICALAMLARCTQDYPVVPEKVTENLNLASKSETRL